MNSSVDRLLFVEDDSGLRRQLAWSFDEYEVQTAENRAAGMQIVQQFAPAVAVIDLGLPPDAQGATEGLALLEEIRTEAPDIKVIVLTGNEDRSFALRAIELGAFDFCSKPMDIDILRTIIQRALHLARLETELRHAAKTSLTPLKGIVTGAPVMLEICRLVERIAVNDISVMLTGESGTGKEVFARAIHNLSSRRDGPFIAINCGAIPENLLESELFGHEKGSFTGAIKQSIGKLEQANNGTLLLDEIGDVPLPLQVKLLRFLQERVIERVGGRQLIAVDVRIICATHRNVPELISEQRFREDLYYRLNEFSLKIPALRERAGDAVLLAHHFLNELKAGQRRELKGFTAGARAALSAYDWPGNVRELQNKIRRAVVIADGDLITEENLDLVERAIVYEDNMTNDEPPISTLTLKEIRQNADRVALQQALLKVNGNVSRAAKMLGISRPTLYDLVRQHGIKL